MNWDKDVLLKIVGLFERINSKRMISHFVLLAFLATGADFSSKLLGVGTWLILLLTLIRYPGGDALAKADKVG